VLAMALLCACIGPAVAQPKNNVFGDPFEQITSAIEACPVPEGPLLTEAEARAESHWRVERGTSCFQSGRCRLPNAYLYDREIIPRVKRFIAQDRRFDRSSLWIIGQRRWVFILGCVETEAQGLAVEKAVQAIDDVESVVGQWSTDTARVPYRKAEPARETTGRGETRNPLIP
jgi:BON domain